MNCQGIHIFCYLSCPKRTGKVSNLKRRSLVNGRQADYGGTRGNTEYHRKAGSLTSIHPSPPVSHLNFNSTFSLSLSTILSLSLSLHRVRESYSSSCYPPIVPHSSSSPELKIAAAESEPAGGSGGGGGA